MLNHLMSTCAFVQFNMGYVHHSSHDAYWLLALPLVFIAFLLIKFILSLITVGAVSLLESLGKIGEFLAAVLGGLLGGILFLMSFVIKLLIMGVIVGFFVGLFLLIGRQIGNVAEGVGALIGLILGFWIYAKVANPVGKVIDKFFGFV